MYEANCSNFISTRFGSLFAENCGVFRYRFLSLVDVKDPERVRVRKGRQDVSNVRGSRGDCCVLKVSVVASDSFTVSYNP